MDELIGRIAAKVGMPEPSAREAVRIIVAFLDREGDAAKVADLSARIPEWADLVAAKEATESDTGFGGLMGGGAMAVLGELQALGLGLGEIQGVTRELVTFARERAGRETVDAVIASIPGLGQFV
jgi:hypothetical protein